MIFNEKAVLWDGLFLLRLIIDWYKMRCRKLTINSEKTDICLETKWAPAALG